MNKIGKITTSGIILVKSKKNISLCGSMVKEECKGEKPIVHGHVLVPDGCIWGNADSEEKLIQNLDSICDMKFDYGLHDSPGYREIIAGRAFFLN